MSSDLKISTYKKLNQYLNDGGQLTSALDSALSATAQPLRITTCGLLKAGKSSLLNALTDHLETELFATGAVRTTVQNQTLSHQDFIFVDTPGLDATEEDDKEAWDALGIADVLLFVHDPGVGELDQAEVKFLLELAGQPGARHGLEERLVVILTRLDSNEEVIDAIAQKVQHQIKSCLGIEPRLFQVSFTSYQNGKLQGKQKLVEYSRIPVLQQYIFENLARMHSHIQTLRQVRIDDSCKELINAVDTEIAKRMEQSIIAQKKFDQSTQAFTKDSETLINSLRTKFAAYDKIY
ncbi:MAG: 50S ribosome-binding GTPase [Burkholderiales bacterium]|nr:50S ribosome-binding GTPase [Burkholderiales bacterium]